MAENEAEDVFQARVPGSSPSESVVIRVGARFTTAIRTVGGRLVASRTVGHGPVLLAASQAEAASANGGAAARVVRAAARQVTERAQIEILRGTRCPVVGTNGIARAVITFGSSGSSMATLAQVQAATDTLGVAWVERKKDRGSHLWVQPMMIGSAVLGAILECLGASEINAEAESPRQVTVDVDHEDDRESS